MNIPKETGNSLHPSQRYQNVFAAQYPHPRIDSQAVLPKSKRSFIESLDHSQDPRHPDRNRSVVTSAKKTLHYQRTLLTALEPTGHFLCCFPTRPLHSLEAPDCACLSPDRQCGCSSECHDVRARAVQSRDWRWKKDGREKTATTGREHRQHPLFTGNTYHITAREEESKASQGPGE